MLSLILFLLCINKTLSENPNDFHMFENFALTKDVYINETELVSKLLQIKLHLLRRLEFLKNPTWKAQPPSFQWSKTSLNELTRDFPLSMDYTGAMKGLVKLQFAYNINLKDFMHKKIISYQNSDGGQVTIPCHETLKSSDFYNLAKLSQEMSLYSVAIDFAKIALKMTDPIDKKVQKLAKDLATLNNGYLSKRQKSTDKDFLVRPYLINHKLEKKKRQPELIKQLNLNENLSEGISADNLFMQVCQKGKFSDYDTISQRSRLFPSSQRCRFLHHEDAYLKLGPFKEEQLSLFPYAVVFRDILSDKEMAYLLDTSKPLLSRKRLVRNGTEPTNFNKHDYKSGGKKVRIVAKTVQAWLDEAEFTKDSIKILHPILWKLAFKIQLATQLKTGKNHSATQMQVTNYGLAGLCEPHMDPYGYLEGKKLHAINQRLKDTGDMLGTFMAWLTNCTHGGATAYLYPGFEGLVMPEKGSAAFWYDLHSTGERDKLAVHAGCPVMQGSKWILNKWMYYFDNFADFPCGIRPKSYFRPPGANHYY